MLSLFYFTNKNLSIRNNNKIFIVFLCTKVVYKIREIRVLCYCDVETLKAKPLKVI
jgi:hypothetical protein